LFHIIGRDKRDALSFRQKASRSCVVQHSKIDLVMPGSGQKPALPRRSIDVRFAPNKQTLTERVQCDAMCQEQTILVTSSR
jgi:hypothetical protein